MASGVKSATALPLTAPGEGLKPGAQRLTTGLSARGAG